MEPVTQDDVLDEKLSKAELIRLFTDLARVEGFADYLRATGQADLIRYFNAPKEQKDLIAGALYRTRYMLNMIQTKGQGNKRDVS